VAGLATVHTLLQNVTGEMSVPIVKFNTKFQL